MGADLRRALRLVPQQVWSLLIRDDDGEVRGMTATSVMPLSVDPPRMVVAVGQSRRTHGALAVGRSCGLSALAAGLEHVGSHFAGLAERSTGVHAISFAGSDPAHPSPRGTLCSLACVVHSLVDLGSSHTLAVLDVVDVAVDAEVDPLLWRLGEHCYLDR